MMKTFGSRIVGTAMLLVIGAVVGEGRARADIPPPDVCTSPGQPCQNAGPNANQSGTCTMTTCQKTMPGPDGGLVHNAYDCNLCRLADGSGGSGGGATSSGGSGGGATSSGGSSAGGTTSSGGSGGGATSSGGSSAGGTTSSGGSGGGATSSGGSSAGGAAPPTTSSSSGCAVAATTSGGGLAWLLVGLGAEIARRRAGRRKTI